MHRDRWVDQSVSVVRRKLGALTQAGMRLLARLTRRLGYPVLATVPVSAVMLSRLQTVNLEQPLEDVAQLLVGGRQHVPVTDHGTPVGVVSRDDVRVAVEVLGPHAPVGEAHRHDVVTVAPSDSLAEVLEQLRRAPDSVAVVVDHGQPVGLLTVERLTAYLAQDQKLA
jgi:CBS domain-containing protein